MVAHFHLFCQRETFLHIYCFLSACFSRNTFADFRLFIAPSLLLKMSSFVIISFNLNFLISIPVVDRFSEFSRCTFITAYYFPWQGWTNTKHQFADATIFCTYGGDYKELLLLSTKLVLCHPSRVQNFQVTPIFLENLYTTAVGDYYCCQSIPECSLHVHVKFLHDVDVVHNFYIFLISLCHARPSAPFS